MSKLGDFYNYIALESYVLSDSDYGDNDYYTWSTYTSCFAERIEVGVGQGRQEELLANNQVYNRSIVTWRIRYDSNVNENMRIYFDGNYYDITGIDTEGRKKFMILKTHKWSS